MRGPSLQKTALLSFALHLTAFLITFLILRQSNHMIMSSPYTVNLVSPDVSTRVDKGIEKGKNEDVEKERRETSLPSDVPKKTKKEAVKEKRLLEDKIDQLRKKKENIEKLDRLRQISIKASHDKLGAISRRASSTAEKSNSSVDYSSKIMDGIQPYWALPPGIEKKGLEAVVSIKILRDGTVIVQGIEKRSGNRLFDRSALQALAKASPLPRPPQEMEIGVKFHP